MKDLRRPAFCSAAKLWSGLTSPTTELFADRSAPAMAELHRWLRLYLAPQLELQVS
jgi:hypothetical protein